MATEPLKDPEHTPVAALYLEFSKSHMLSIFEVTGLRKY
jgi:hypothetical protein